VEQGGGVATAARIGDEVQDGSFTFKVTNVETGAQALGDSFLRSEAQGMYVLVHVTVTNVGTESALFTSANQALLDAQGREFDADAGAALMNVPDSESFLTDINPGNSVEGARLRRAGGPLTRCYRTARVDVLQRDTHLTRRLSPLPAPTRRRAPRHHATGTANVDGRALRRASTRRTGRQLVARARAAVAARRADLPRRGRC
jgi:hypothetical protein